MPTSIAVSLNSPSPPPAARLSASPPGSPRRELPAHNQSRSPPRVPALIVRHPSPSYSNGNGGNGYSYGNGSTGNGSSNGGASASPTAAGHTHARAPQLSFPPISSTSSNRRVAAVPLLIPTDRTIDDLEENWLPRLGKVRVEREVRLTGYSLYGIRSWYLSRDHWAFTIIAGSGKPTDEISCYVIGPSPELSDVVGAAALAKVTERLAHEVQGIPRKTEFGTVIVGSPAGYGQDLSLIQKGDMREAWPYIVLNTALRRLGCGGRAAMGNDFPVPAVRRKFYELYRIAPPKGGGDETLPSPPVSPKNATFDNTTSSSHQLSAETVANSPILINVVELVKLLQGALAIWGMYGSENEELELDGLFCDDTKAGLFEWRRVMGMESDDGYKLEKATSGGCIDPHTLAALLTSITSVRYQLAALGVEKVPKDPFGTPRKFLYIWRSCQQSMDKPIPRSEYLCVPGIRALNAAYIAGRYKTHATDALKVHRLIISGVTSATNNLRGNTADDGTTPLRKREQHKHFHGSHDSESGVGMIVTYTKPEPAAPDVITTDLEAYRKLIMQSREREWDAMGARRVAELWSGVTAKHGPDHGNRQHGRLQAFRRRVTKNKDDKDAETDDDTPPSAIGAFKGMRDRTGAAIKGGFGLVGRRHGANVDDTSDSEGPSRGRRKQPSVPLVVEPEDEPSAALSRSPSPTSMMPITPTNTRPPHANYPAIQSPLQQSINLSTSNLGGSLGAGAGGDMSDISPGMRSSTGTPLEPRTSIALSVSSANERTGRSPNSIPAPQLAPRMLRMNSSPAAPDLVLDTSRTAASGPATALGLGLYPEQKYSDAGPGGGGSGSGATGPAFKLKRNKTFTCAEEYRGVRRKLPQHLAVDVEMCALVWDLRKRERELDERATDMQTMERSAVAASQAIFDARDQRATRVTALERDAAILIERLEAGEAAVDDDEPLHRIASNVEFFLSEETNQSELRFNLEKLQALHNRVKGEPVQLLEAPPPPPKSKGWFSW